MAKPTPTFYLFHGDDDFRLEQEVNTFRAKMLESPNADLNISEFDGQNVSAAEVINAGMVSATSWQGARLYDEIAGRFDEEWVVAAFWHNDRWLRPVADAQGGTGVAVALLQQSRSVLLLSGLLSRLRPARDARLVPRVSPDEHAASLMALASRAAAVGARAIFVSLPDNPEPARAAERARELAAQGRVRFTMKALRELTALDLVLDEEDACHVLANLAASDFVERLGSRRTGEWMYVFRPRVGGVVVYMKLILRSDCVVLSFHEEEERGDEDE